MKTKLKSLSIVMGLTVALTGFSGGAGAAGFQLLEQNASGLGNAFAGTAAVAEDASTIFFNPAGMTRLPASQAVVAVSAIRLSAKFHDAGSSTPFPGGVGTNEGGDAGDWAFLPILYYAMDLNPNWKFGLGINSPFGLKTEYSSGWIGRFQGIKSELDTININPSLAYKISDTASVGFGISAERVKAELTSNAGPLGVATINADDWNYGANIGALFQISPSTRVGAAYRSEIKHSLSGDVAFSSAPAGNGPITADVTFPASLTLSLLTGIDPKWDVLADLSWTEWSKFQTLDIHFTSGAPLSSTTENWKDSYRLAVGTNYKYSESWKLRAGIAYDQSPVSDEFRTVRIPDNNRTWLAFGAKYTVSKGGYIDFGYAHLFVKDAPINQTQTTGVPSTVLGNYKNSVDVLGAQYTYTF
ncbi:MAG TPA: outer membrane protein transport protein [Acidiferrobacterales bacterium]|nr:outer membrane protein transport protein [Acidiferrobacterales bacterium]